MDHRRRVQAIRLLGTLVLTALVGTLLALSVTERPLMVEGDVLIQAPPAQVWAALTAESRYGEWNPTITAIDGPLRPGGRLHTTEGKGADAVHFRPRVVRVVPGRELSWNGSLYTPGLISAQHRFQLLPENGGTRFVQSEVFTGLLIGTWTENTVEDTRASLDVMNLALKRWVESQQAL